MAGRPEYAPTDTQRAMVESAAAYGVPQADIAECLDISVNTLVKHFRDELISGKFKVHVKAGSTVVKMLDSKDERVALESAKWYTARRMGWKETTVTENTGKDGGPIEVRDTSAVDLIREQIASATERLEDKTGGNGAETADE